MFHIFSMFRRGSWLFYDIPATRLRGEMILLASDFLMLLAPLCLATGILHRTGVDAASLLVWVAISRALARSFSWLEQPRSPWRLYTLSLTFAFTMMVLLLVGWGLIYEVRGSVLVTGWGTAGIILAAWLSGCFLHLPRMYPYYDFLCGLGVLFGILEWKPEAWLWVPLYFGAWLFSSSTRHILYDVPQVKKRSRINLQNARVLSLAGTLVASLIFVPACLLSNQRIKFFQDSDWNHLHGGIGMLSGLIAPPPSRRARDQGMKIGKITIPGAGEKSEDPSGDEANADGQLTYRIRTSFIAHRPQDYRIAWRIWKPDGKGEGPGLWPPYASCVWRGATFSDLDMEGGFWQETKPLHKKPWPPEGSLVLESVDPLERAVALEHEVRIPVFQSLLSLHRTVKFSAEGLEEYLANDARDIFPVPSLKPGFKYQAGVVPRYPNRFPLLFQSGSHPDTGRYLKIPPPEDLGFDLAAMARRIIPQNAKFIQEKIFALRNHFLQNEFKYVEHKAWNGSGEDLREFLEDSRRGNCTCFATAAILFLRAANVSARLALGFAGGDWDQDRQEVVLRISMAHAWLEVYFPKVGWLPCDPTAWVPAERPEGEPENLAASSLPSPGFPEPIADSGNGIPGDPGERSAGETGETSLASREIPERERSGETLQKREPPGESSQSSGQGYDDGFEFVSVISKRPKLLTGREQRKTSTAEPAAPRVPPEWPRYSGKLLRIVLLAMTLYAGLLLVVTYRLHRKKSDEKQKDDDPEKEEPEGEPFLSPGGDFRRWRALFNLDDPRDAVIATYQRLQMDLMLTRNHRRSSQTPLEHGSWLAGRFEDLREPIGAVVRLLYRAIYGDGRVNREDAREHAKNCRRIRRYLV